MENNFLDELNDFIIEEEAKELGIDVSTEGFSVTSMEQANFFLRRLKELEDEKQQVQTISKEQIESYIEKVNKFTEIKLKELQPTIDYFTFLLEQYAKQELEGKKTKTCKLAFGDISFRKTQPKLVYGETFDLEFVKENLPDFIKQDVKLSIDKAKLKKEVNIIDGEVYYNNNKISGIDVEPAGESLSVKFK